jgi:hypothetical protein
MHGYIRSAQRYKEKKEKRADYENAVSGWIWSEIDDDDGMRNG